MNDDILKQLWQGQPIPAPSPLSGEEQSRALQGKMKRFNRDIFRRDIRENVAGVVVVLVFAYYLRVEPSLLARVGSVITILSAIFACWYPAWSKRRVPRTGADASVIESLQEERQKVEVQIRLLRSVLWWYILPISLGANLFCFGSHQTLSFKISFLIGSLLLDAFLYWLNQSAVQKHLVPMKRELEAILNLEETVLPPEPPTKNTMTKIILLGIALLLLGAIVFVRANSSKSPVIEYSDQTSKMLETIRVKHKFPSLAAAVVVDGKVVATNVVGFRKNGGAEVVLLDDKYHLGSVTKSMTATVAAMLVEQGKISWTSTIGELFPELKSETKGDYLGVTLEQLLAQRSGAPGAAPADLWRKAWAAKGTPAEQRLAFIKGILSRKPEVRPGTKFIYSNQGYTIAGVMLEKASGKSWEKLMRSMLFEPLGMTTAGFGAPASVGKVDQPWGHTRSAILGYEPFPPGPGADNPLAITPAGAVHCSIGDLAKYAAFHLSGERGESKLLKAESFKKLHKAVGGDYALGWVVLERGWAHGRALMHNGSNTMFYVVVWMAPERNSAVIVATNVGVDSAFQGCDEAASQLITQFLGE
jgi:CubicO group peptidase (beta-lactamase class C family)